MTDPAAANAVEIRDLFRLHRGRAGDVAALRGLTLTVGAGERVVVHGPNGSGKTTLLRVLTGEQQPSAGTVAVAGQDLQNADEAALARLRSGVLGLVDQHRSRSLRPELDVRDNVALHQRIAGVSARRARSAAEELLGSLGIGDLARRDVTTLSGGEAQRVAICAALAHVPSVVLADEPTGDLDTDNAEAVYDLLAAATASAGSALLLVTHDSRAGRIADRVVRIRDGRVSEQWQPTSAVETVLVDDRGWLRLPEHLRSAAGVTTGVHVSEHAGRIVLTPPSAARSSTEGAPVTQAEPVPGAVVAAMHGIGHAVGGRRLFDGVDLTARRGCLTVVRGPSGTGKSTLLRLLVGLEDPASGQVQICGTDLAALSRADRARLRRRLVAVAGQGKALAESLDVEGNVALARSARGLPADRSAVDAAVAAVGLTSLARRDVAVLSGGERQRVALARVLVSEAPLVVLDEPTSSLDEAGATRVGDLLAGLARAGAAVVAATHDPVLVTRADEVLEVPRVGFEPTRHRV